MEENIRKNVPLHRGKMRFDLQNSYQCLCNRPKEESDQLFGDDLLVPVKEVNKEDEPSQNHGGYCPVCGMVSLYTAKKTVKAILSHTTMV